MFSILICAISCQNKEDWSFPNVFFGFAVDGFPVNERVLELQSETKINPEMIVFYLQWPEPSKPYPSIVSSLDAIWKLGAVPCLTWEPMTVSDLGEKTVPYEDILSGQYDPYLIFMAREVKRWGKPLIIRFAQEMNISRYHWGTSKEEFGPDSPQIYIKMFQYVVKFFKNQKVDPVLWAFCPNVDSIPNEAWNAAKKYYPGDEYVDILGMDGYNWNINEELAATRKQSWVSHGRSFEQIFHPLYKELNSIHSSKPIIVFETASVSRIGDPKKSIWIQDALKVSKKWGIKGIVWFQVKKEEDWRIHQNDDYSYSPFIKRSEPSFQTWLLNYTIYHNHSMDFK